MTTNPVPDPTGAGGDLDALADALADKATVRSLTIQVIRSTSQIIGNTALTYPAVLEGLDAAGLDPTDPAIQRAVFAVSFVLWLVIIRVLERVHPLFRWLNGWPTRPSYDTSPRPEQRNLG